MFLEGKANRELISCQASFIKVRIFTKIPLNVERGKARSERAPSETGSVKLSSTRKLWGFLNRRERWGLSMRGWFALLLVAVGVSIVAVLSIHPFLAMTQREDADILVVEGWVPDFAIRAAADEFAAHSYQRAFTTGGPVRGMGGYTNDYNTSASVGAARLKAAGVPGVQMVPSRVMDRDRTYAAAIALRNWFHANNLHPRTINVVTEGAHARRTRFLFQKAFRDEITVGIIAITSPDYDGRHWWLYSEGVRDVIGETLAYLYAQVFFHPSKTDGDPAPHH